LKDPPLTCFDQIYAIAAQRKGGETALEALLEPGKSPEQLSAITDDRWLSQMTKCVFQAGFNWKVVEAMWPGFEQVFHDFDVGRCSMLNDDDVARLINDKRIVRHGTKIRSVQQNAVFIENLGQHYGSAGKAFGQWPNDDFTGLLALMKKQGARLGGNTGQYFLRFMGVDGFILSRDVVARLIHENVIDKMPASKKSMAQVQAAFNQWHRESGRSLTDISRILAMSIGP